MLFWTLATATAAPDCDVDTSVSEAIEALLIGDASAARAALDRAGTALACDAPAQADTLGRWWVVDGVLRHQEGDLQGAADSFASAARLAPQLWLPGLSEELRAAYDAAELPAGTGLIVISPDPGDRPVWIDGAPMTSAEVPTGLHVIQVGEPGGAPVFASTLWVGDGLTHAVETGLPPAALPPGSDTPEGPGGPEGPEGPGGPEAPERSGGPRLQIHLLTGGRAAIGGALASGADQEPATKLSIPLEVGVGLAGPGWWFRLHGGVGPLIGGRYLSADPAGNPIATPLHVDAGGALAGQLGAVHLGLLGAVHWPSRIAARALAGWSPTDGPWLLELRGGANLPTERAPEPAVELLIGLKLP